MRGPIRLTAGPATLLALLTLSAPALAAPTVTEYTVPTHDRGPLGLAAGPDGNLWFTESLGGGAIGRSTPSGTMTEFTAGLSAAPDGIAAGPDGNLWFTEPSKAKIGRITTSGTITEFTAKGIEPVAIAAGPDGNMWFTESGNPAKIGRITTSGTITEFSTGLTATSQPLDITAGPDGNMWFTEAANPGRIGRITPSGTITEFSSGLTQNSQPTGIAAGPDGNLWFTEKANPGKIGRITTSGAITEFATGLSPNMGPVEIAAANDGDLYFTESLLTGAIGKITPEGTISEYAIPTPTSIPKVIRSGPDGNIWFTEFANPGKLGMITVPPLVGTTGSSGVAENVATLEASVGPNSQSTSYQFQYGTTTAYGSSSPSSSAGSGATAATVSTPLSGLSAGTTYHFRAVASNGAGTSYGPDQTLTTISPPGALTQPASAVTLTGAILNGTVNPQGHATTYHFEWGSTSSYGSNAPASEQTVGADSSKHQLEAELTGLSTDHLYHFRVVASNCGGCAEGTTYGSDQTFTTASPPSASTEGAEAVGLTSATVTGSVNPHGAAASYHFDWGETTAYGKQAPMPDASAGADGSAHELAQALEGLHPGTTYHYRIVATNCEGCVAGTSYGADQTFKTVPAPGATTLAAQAVGLTGATIAASVNPYGTATTYHFEWGETSAYGAQAPAADGVAGSDASPHELLASLGGLQPGTTYHYRVVASNCGGCAAGTAYGEDGTFTTTPAPLAVTGSAQAIGLSSATLTGTVNPNGEPTSYRFDWGETSAYGAQAPLPEASAGSDAAPHALSQELAGLAPGTTYHYRLVASECEGCTAGTSYGADETFTTASDTGAGGPERPLLGARPTPAALATGVLPPQLGGTALAEVRAGTVRVRVPGSSALVALTGSGDIPVGSLVDATRGTIVVTTAVDEAGHTQSATVWGGAFLVGQTAAPGGMTTFSLSGQRPRCGRPEGRAARAPLALASAHPPKQGLWAKDHGGHFSTRGQNSVATVRGTYWGTIERCDGTETIVRSGKVSVHPLHRGRTVLVRAGQHFLARP